MPYNTRRKSLSLADLGVVLPKRSRAISHPSPPSTIAEGDESERPAKISKKSHVSSASPPPRASARGAMSPPKAMTVRIKDENPKQELSPPPSPTTEGFAPTKVNLEGVSDDIVVATIQQLEETGNRPIFVRELAALLPAKLHSVEKSANPCALISSRLTAYLHRAWPTISPCPLAKDLSPVHPRRLYFYLTTMPKQPVPLAMDPILKPHRIISPSLSSASAADEDDEQYNRARQALSPSPEVDLSTPELDNEDTEHPPTPGAPFSARNSVSRSRAASNSDLTRHRRAGSPPLEREERDFKQTANALHEQALQRRNSQQSHSTNPTSPHASSSGADGEEEPTVSMSIEEDSEESRARKTSEDAAALFGQADHLKPLGPHSVLFSSPLLGPQNALRIDTGSLHSKSEKADEPMENLNLDQHRATTTAVVSSKDDVVEVMLDWDDLQSPENVEMAELEDMFDSY
ncbi:hypothetical protein BDY17DRAFT_320145 [Neohortaea acidophila]|uniref:GDS1 winged helix domain-containing protein n=1 Tax=Neohortaea acidophila TaxID=245834 RepID=A0A6A6Q8B2_9PEZI|nr:uncharacterized protein BDY17DRAFT_320145 [Neohortaea acidophila]KAF2487617.1 hypothetical protein BDY17DRAFT_320145 [Neohortaea acidophila]